MIVEKIDVLPLKAPLIYPFRTALGQHDSLENLLVRLTLKNSVVGLGEAAIATHITGETIPDSRKNLKAVGSALLGRDIRAWRKIPAFLFEQLLHNKAALAAIEMAVFDALTRSRGVPLWSMFGPRPKRLATDITVVITSLDDTKAAVKKFYRQGFRSFKVKIGRDQDVDFKRVLAVHDLAPRCAIYLDANQGYSAATIISFLKKLRAYGVRPKLIEQPVPRDDWDGLVEISRAKLAPVCADESVRSLADCRRVSRLKAAGVINIKLMKTGLVESSAIARLAHKNGLKLMIGGMMESSLAMTAAAHLAAGMGIFDFVDLDTPFFIRGSWQRNPYLSKTGVYDLKKVKAGIGLSEERL